jgi:hypothetical protein
MLSGQGLPPTKVFCGASPDFFFPERFKSSTIGPFQKDSVDTSYIRQ